jgi:protein O-GlcNAc transferase
VELLVRTAEREPIMTPRPPSTPDDWNAIAAAMEQQGKYAEAANACLRSLALDAKRGETFFGLGNALLNLGQLDHAITAYRTAVALRPDFPEALNNLGFALRAAGQHIEAIDAFQRAVALRPHYVDALNNLGMSLGQGGLLDEAIACFEKALLLRPEFAPALTNMGNACQATGRLDAAIDCFRRAWKSSLNSSAPDNLLYALHFHPAYGPAQIKEEHDRWNQQIAKPLAPARIHHSNDPSPDRRLRIGYVSPDFCSHSQANFTLPLFSHHDHSQFEIFCYSDVRASDELTGRLRGYADAWRDTAALSHAQLVELIFRDRIDILVDLTLHMSANRLLTFAHKPAPVQVTWLGYPSTTGLETIDYRLSDPYLDPHDANEKNYSEKTFRLPHSFWCYDPLDDGPSINGLPALPNGFITFGCLNNFAKVTPPTLELWARVMRDVPRSRLLLLAPRGSARPRLLDAMTNRGIDLSRIEFCDRVGRDPYLATFNRFDISLDTIPYPGHTTTLDSLWMGVPVVTLTGSTTVSRGGLSILSNLSLNDFVTTNADDYVAAVSRLAHDASKLTSLRSSLRTRLQASPLMNAAAFAIDVESAFRRMWKTWCTLRPSS